ncbi:MAG: glycosyltransferase family 4 protein [Candidatus Nealsonbacteria bacterium]|nr:glycosyltransferase family 4 protein [Candidatus Nealsonbacteria bacterium]
MRILLITANYYPEIRSIAMMCKELAEELVSRGHKVTVLTNWPRHNLPGGISPESFKIETEENGVRVLRVKALPIHRINYYIRGIAQITSPFLFLRILKKRIREKIDKVIIYSPPIFLARMGAILKRKHKACVLLNVQDIFPQNAIDLGILRNKLLIKYFERVEYNAYRAADVLTTCTEGARQFLINHKMVPPEKVFAIYNWIDFGPYEKARPAGFRSRYGLNGKFVIVFAGVMGPSQGLEYVIGTAREVADCKDIVFLLLGDGTSRPCLEKIAKRYMLKNVRFGDFVSPRDYPSLLKEMDVGLIALEKNCKTPTIPGKFFGFAAAKLPILAFLNQESEGHKIIKEAKCGYSIIPECVKSGAKLVRRMRDERQMFKYFGENGYNYAKTRFSKEKCINKIENIFIFSK